MKKALFYIGLMLLSACSGKDKKAGFPEDGLNEDQMVAVLIDFQINETLVASFPGASDTLNNATLYEYEQTLEKHHITKEQFEKSMDFYSLHPEELTTIMTRVVDSLSVMEAKIVPPAIQPPTADSL